jgi:hypothetical protein
LNGAGFRRRLHSSYRPIQQNLNVGAFTRRAT